MPQGRSVPLSREEDDMPRVQESDSVEICCGCGWAQATIDGYCLDCAPSWAEGVCNPWDNDHEHEWDCDD